MDRLNHVNIKQEEQDGQKEILINNAQQQQNNKCHDASSCQLSGRAPKHVKKEEEDEDGIVKQVQPCTKVKKEEGDGECIKLEWDVDECDCEECRVDRQIKVEFKQNNATKNQVHQDNSSQWNSDTKNGVPSQSSVCKRVKKEEEEEGDDQWDEDCDCDDCRRMSLKVIRLKQINSNQESRTQNREAGGDDDEETEIDKNWNGNKDVLVENDGNMAVDDQIGDEDGDELDQEGEKSGDGQESSEDQMSDADDETEIDENWNGNEDVLVGNDGNMAVDDQIGDEDGDELDQEGEKSGDGQESSEDQMSDADDETEIDDEEYEMEVGGEDESSVGVNEDTEQFVNQIPIQDDHRPNRQVVEIEKEERDEETEIEDNEGDEESQTVEDARIEITLPRCNGQTRKIVKQSARHLKRKQIDYSSATECSANPIQPNLAQPNRRFQCSHCHKSFDRKSRLLGHFRVHTRHPFHCDQCDKRFGERSKLTQHQLIHQNIKPFQCDQCDKRFNWNSNLTAHQLIHQNIKRFQCHECDKRFTQKYSLDSHLLIHTGERPFACRHSDKSFSQLFHRNSHEQSIHLHVKPYRCKQCGHTATVQSATIEHIRVIHFGFPKSIKQQRALNIVDDRDPRELLEKV